MVTDFLANYQATVPDGMLVTYGPAPRILCTNCDLVAPLSPERAPADVAELAEAHKHGVRTAPWVKDS